jgi:signal transduction histidine kinase
MELEKETFADNFRFIQGGGEMGAVTRSFDWSNTTLGMPHQWPQSLRTTLGVILHSGFPMFLFWGEDLLCFYNDAFRPSLGVDGKHPAVGKKGREVWADIWDFVGPLVKQVMTTGEPVFFEDQYVPFYRNGKTEDIYWTFSYSPAYGDNGQINGVFVTCTETTEKVLTVKGLTEQASAHKRIEAAEQRVRSFVESAPFPIGVYIGREMRIEFANQSILDVWGKGNNVIGRLYTEVLPELSNQEIFAQLDSVYSTGIPFHARNQQVDIIIDGKLQPFFFNYSFTPLHDSTGHIYGVMNTAAEVTDLNLAKLKVEQSERNVRNMIIQAPVAMCILLGPEHVVEVANGLMIELWGKPVAAVMNKPIFEGLPDAREQGLEQLLSDVYNTGVTFKANERPIILVRNGKTEPVYQNFVYEPYRDANGSILGVLAITIDVTEQVIARQKIEEAIAERTKELAAANNSLQKSNAELAQFAHIASHDLQEPIRKVSTYAQMLETSLGKPDDRTGNYIDKIKHASSRMLTLIKDVLAYSELSGNNENYTTVNLHQVLEEVKTDFELLIGQKQALIQLQSLPEIEAIPLQMSQLFGNLLSNALKYSRPGIQPEISVTASPLSPEGYYRIEFKDNGIGFRQEHASQIFNIFQRLHGKKKYEGTGIGLAICQKIILNHHGEILAQSEPDAGSTFIIKLPARQAR